MLSVVSTSNVLAWMRVHELLDTAHVSPSLIDTISGANPTSSEQSTPNQPEEQKSKSQQLGILH